MHRCRDAPARQIGFGVLNAGLSKQLSMDADINFGNRLNSSPRPTLGAPGHQIPKMALLARRRMAVRNCPQTPRLLRPILLSANRGLCPRSNEARCHAGEPGVVDRGGKIHLDLFSIRAIRANHRGSGANTNGHLRDYFTCTKVLSKFSTSVTGFDTLTDEISLDYSIYMIYLLYINKIINNFISGMEIAYKLVAAQKVQ